MSWLSIYQPTTVEAAVQRAFLGRVALRENYTSGTTLKVGTDPVGSSNGESGVYLFIDTGTAVTVVEPGSHEEAATLVAPDIDDLHLELAGELAQDYTTAAGAYVRPTSLPAAVAALKVCDRDPIESLMASVDPAVISERLPGIALSDQGFSSPQGPSVQYEGMYRFRVRYARIASPRESTQTHLGYVEQVVNMIYEDPHLGGRVDWADIERVLSVDPETGAPNRAPLTESSWILWADIVVSAMLTQTFTKAT
jgi:hypothetical protein